MIFIILLLAALIFQSLIPIYIACGLFLLCILGYLQEMKEYNDDVEMDLMLTHARFERYRQRENND